VLANASQRPCIGGAANAACSSKGQTAIATTKTRRSISTTINTYLLAAAAAFKPTRSFMHVIVCE